MTKRWDELVPGDVLADGSEVLEVEDDGTGWVSVSFRRTDGTEGCVDRLAPQPAAVSRSRAQVALDHIERDCQSSRDTIIELNERIAQSRADSAKSLTDSQVSWPTVFDAVNPQRVVDLHGAIERHRALREARELLRWVVEGEGEGDERKS